MVYKKVYIHLAWSTKKRKSFLASKELGLMICNHIRENAQKRDFRGFHQLNELKQYRDDVEASIKESQQQNEMFLQHVLREALEPKTVLN